jgi:hypothetical protein
MTLHVDVSGVPKVPAVYAMYGGDLPRTWVAYAGMAGNLQQRLFQHFINRDSSVVTGTGAAGLNIEWVRLVPWWEHPMFEDGDARHASELVAFEVLDPALRSRGNPSAAALKRQADPGFRDEMRTLLTGPPSGELVPPRVPDLAGELARLTDRVEALEAQLSREQ